MRRRNFLRLLPIALLAPEIAAAEGTDVPRSALRRQSAGAFYDVVFIGKEVTRADYSDADS